MLPLLDHSDVDVVIADQCMYNMYTTGADGKPQLAKTTRSGRAIRATCFRACSADVTRATLINIWKGGAQPPRHTIPKV